MATPRTTGRSADLSEDDEIIKKARKFIGLLENPALSAAMKTDLIVLLEEVIKSRQEDVTTVNHPEKTTEVGQITVIENPYNTIEQKLEELKTITLANGAKVEELKTIITTTSERT